jgi:tail tube protein
VPKVRPYGADAMLKACRETSYGVAPLTGYRSLDFKSCDLSAEQPLGDDPLLGRGRNAQDPYRGLITDEGRIEIPLDLRGSGFWLTGLFGNPTVTRRFFWPAGGEQHHHFERHNLDVRDRHALGQPDADRRQSRRHTDGARDRSQRLGRARRPGCRLSGRS